MAENKNVLVVEPNERDAELTEKCLGDAFVADRARGTDEAIRLLKNKDYVAAVITLDGGEEGGLILYYRMLKDGLDVPTVILHGEAVTPDTVERIRQAGCQCLSKNKNDVPLLPVVIKHAIEIKEIERRSRLLKDVVDRVSEGIITAGANGRILTANSAVTTIFGYEPEELKGRDLAVLFPPQIEGNSPDKLVSRTIEDGRWADTLTGVRKKSGTVPVGVSTFLEHGSRGEPGCIVCMVEDLTERKDLIARLDRYAVTDELTGLFNYRYFMDRLQYEYRRARRYGVAMSCILLDLDYFRAINDSYGNSAGDTALVAVAAMIKQCTREVDVIARYGGEEFAVLLPSTGREGARACADKIRRAVAETPIAVGAIKIHVTASVGASTTSRETIDEQELLREADTGLQIAKERGRNRVCEWGQVMEADAKKEGRHMDGPAKLTELRQRLLKLNGDLKPNYIEHIKPLIEEAESGLKGVFAHSSRVARYASRLAAAALLPPAQIEIIRYAAFLHDIGRAAVPQGIWQKPGALSPEETEKMRTHVVISHKLVGEIAFMEDEAAIIRHHQERWDGTGYPDGLVGENIPMGSRVIAVCNTYDALRNDRPHRKAMSKEEAVEEIKRSAGSQLDPRLVELFLGLLEKDKDTIAA